MRTVKLRNKAVWLYCVAFCVFVVLVMKRWSVQSFYRRALYSGVDDGEDLPWPPRLKIVRQEIGAGHKGSEATGENGSARQRQFGGGQACRWPDLQPDDPDLRHLFFEKPPLQCASERDWVSTGDGKFLIDAEAVRRHGRISCDYTNYWRVSDAQTDERKLAGFASGSPLQGDFFKVWCKAADGASYDNVHATVVPSQEAIDRARSAQPPSDSLPLNVYMLGFDSLSRMTFMRKMPKTYEYLEKSMEAVVLQGYNIVGDGTPQALIPILTGKTEKELPLTRKRFRNANYVDVYPFVWNEFRKAGYVTLYGEDAAAVGTFTYRLRGFNKQPTDHYMRTFYMVAESEVRKHNKFCWGSEPHHRVHFNYSEQLWRNYPKDVRKFAFQFHSVLSHNDINDVGVADQDMVEHLRLFKENYMNDTILIFMSDHGHRFASLRETQQGKLEERLPFFSFSFPPWFAERYPHAAKAFRANAHRLTTPFDIHETLKSILHFRPVPKVADLSSRGLSLFDIIPTERSCSDANVEPHWCACLSWTAVASTERIVQYMARAVVEAINAETAKERGICAELKLKTVVSALRYSPAEAVMRYKQARDRDGEVPDLTDTTPVSVQHFQINFRTTPGDAHYEASVSWNRRTNEVAIDLDVVSHINKYGDLPHCIIDKDYFMAKWCVCYDKINTTLV